MVFSIRPCCWFTRARASPPPTIAATENTEMTSTAAPMIRLSGQRRERNGQGGGAAWS